MELRPGYKQTEVGVIPCGWELAPLSRLSAFITKGSTPTTYGFKWEPTGVLFLRSECVSEDGLDLKQSMFISPIAHAALRRSEVRDGDILITITGNVGRAVLLAGVGEANLNQHIARVRVTAPDANPTFVFHVLSQPTTRRYFSSITTGQAYPQISLQQVRNAEVPMPAIAEQRAIAAALSDVDALLAKLDQLIAKKRDLKQAAMQQLLTGQTRLPGFSGEWAVRRLGDLFTFYGGYSASRDQLSAVGHCYLHYGDIHKSSRAFIDVRSEYQDIPKLDVPLNRVSAGSLLDDGDVVFVDASEDDEGTSRHMVVINKDKTPYIAGLHTIVAKGKTQELAHEYRRHCFQTAAMRQQFLFFAVGTKVAGINKSNIVKLTLPVPPLAEQTAIATILSDIDAELTALAARRDKTRALKQGMMQELLTGRIRLV